MISTKLKTKILDQFKKPMGFGFSSNTMSPQDDSSIDQTPNYRKKGSSDDDSSGGFWEDLSDPNFVIIIYFNL